MNDSDSLTLRPDETDSHNTEALKFLWNASALLSHSPSLSAQLSAAAKSILLVGVLFEYTFTIDCPPCLIVFALNLTDRNQITDCRKLVTAVPSTPSH